MFVILHEINPLQILYKKTMRLMALKEVTSVDNKRFIEWDIIHQRFLFSELIRIFFNINFVFKIDFQTIEKDVFYYQRYEQNPKL
jgi:hypothetical protein